VVFDLCVNYFDETGLLGDGYGATVERVQECAYMVSVADAVTCASKFIAQRARAFHPHVVYLPDSIDRRHFWLRKSIEDFDRNPLRAIWSGTAVKAQELNPIIPVLADRGIELTLISNARPQLAEFFSFVPWTYETFPRRILDGELCLSYRATDNPYDLGHSLFKVGVFMAQGVPALASPVPSYKEIINGECGGQICSTLQEWAAALDRLLADRDVLKKWSGQAIAALEPYSTERIIEQYVTLFRELRDS